MKGREVIKVNKTFTLEELAAFMDAHWDAAEFGGYQVGRPTPASIEEYIILPATKNCLVILYPRDGKVILSVAQTPAGVGKMAFTAIPTGNAIAGIAQASASISLAKELRGPANDIMLIYAEQVKKILAAEGLL